MTLPWVRLDTNIASHDKILALLSDPSPKRWQAAFSYCSALAYSGGHGTDGRIPKAALPFVHGTSLTAQLLVKYGLWHARTADWLIVNYAERQELTSTTVAKREAQSLGGKKSRCQTNHGYECGCWKEAK